MIVPLPSDTERILTLHLSTYEGFVNLVCIYTPTIQAIPEFKDQFYAQLDSIVKHIPSYEHIYFLKDFNARVGADQVYCPSMLGHHGIRKINENGQRLKIQPLS